MFISICSYSALNLHPEAKKSDATTTGSLRNRICSIFSSAVSAAKWLFVKISEGFSALVRLISSLFQRLFGKKAAPADPVGDKLKLEATINIEKASKVRDEAREKFKEAERIASLEGATEEQKQNKLILEKESLLSTLSCMSCMAEQLIIVHTHELDALRKQKESFSTDHQAEAIAEVDKKVVDLQFKLTQEETLAKRSKEIQGELVKDTHQPAVLMKYYLAADELLKEQKRSSI